MAGQGTPAGETRTVFPPAAAESIDRPFRLGILVGRFQTLHLGHGQMIETALRLCGEVGILIGSSQEERTEKNPFSYAERRELLRCVFGDRVRILPLPDLGAGNNSRWGEYVLQTVREAFGCNPDLLISGKEERRSSWFEGCDGARVAELYVPKTVEISATQMRDFFLRDDRGAFCAYTDPKLWQKYDELRQIVLASRGKTETRSI